MASDLLSRWRTSNNPSASIYETIRQQDEESEQSDIEEQGRLHLSENVPDQSFHDVESADHFENDSQRSPRHTSIPGRPQHRSRASHGKRTTRPRWLPMGRKLMDVDEGDDDVPASLLIEGEQFGLGQGSIALPPPPSAIRDRPTRPTPDSAMQQHERRPPITPPRSTTTLANIANADPKELASWRWANVVNLDNFLTDVYNYYLGSGFWSILLRRSLNLATIAFLVGFTLLVTQCIDYSRIKDSRELAEIVVPRCTARMGILPNLFLWFLTLGWIYKAFEYIIDIRRLRNMHDFYLYMLNITEAEVPSISWQEIVSRLMALRDSNPTLAPNVASASKRWQIVQSRQRMDAHDIANRLMRRDNYMIALINKDILDMSLPIPWMRNRQFFSRTLEWNVNWCIMDFVFNSKGQIRPLFLKDTHRKGLSDALKRRFVFAGWANLVIAPILITFAVLQNFFIHFNEYQKNPAAVGSKTYNVLAEWKFREFNELHHLFLRRINMSQPFAARYVDQFPRDKVVQIARFVAFVTGAIVAVLGLVALFDQENFLTFELTSGRTVLFWLGITGGMWAVARGLIPEANSVYEPAFAMQEVIDFTHYEPAHWRDRLHTVEVKSEFEQLYQTKLLMFIEEVLSMVLTPFVLWLSLTKCSDRIIDFFREFTVHVDGIGYVCSFAEFKLRQPVNENVSSSQFRASNRPELASEQGLRDEYFTSKDQKLEQSYWGFMNDYARNPKADVRLRHGTAKRRLNMPPPMPGLLSPGLPATFGSLNVTASGRHASLPSPQRTAHPSSAPLSNAQAIGSPLQSILLDPHHQPSASGFGSSQGGRLRSSHTNQHAPRRKVPERTADVVEEVDEDDTHHADNPPAVSTGELGSWKYDDENSVTSDDEDDKAAAQDGVVGLIRQLRTQGEGNRAAGL